MKHARSETKIFKNTCCEYNINDDSFWCFGVVYVVNGSKVKK